MTGSNNYGEFAINNTVHCSTKQTPSKMLSGVEQKGEVVNELTEYLKECYGYGNNYESLDEIRKSATKEIQRSQLRNQKYHDEHYKPAKEFKN